MIKKIALFFTLVFTLMILYGCGEKPLDYDSMIGDDIITLPVEVTEDLELPTSIEIEGLTFHISWSSDHVNVINTTGQVTRPAAGESDVHVVMTAEFSLALFKKSIQFHLTVKALPQTVSYEVMFDSQGGSFISTQIIDQGSLVLEPTAPTKDGFEFLGWYQDQAYSTVWNFMVDTITTQMTLYAKWREITLYTVTFENAEGGVYLTKLIEENQYVLPPETSPEKLGYTFDSWKTTSGLVFSFSTILITENITLVPSYNPIIYTITYDIPKDAMLSETGAVSYDITQEGTLKTATMMNMTFIGWFTEQKGGIEVTSIPIGSTGDMKLYARFENNEEIPVGTLIYTSDDLFNLITQGGSGDVYLMNDIDMTGVTLTGSSKTFNGTFDGRGHVIRGAVIYASGNKLGFLFKEVLNGGTVKNVTFADSIHHGGGNAESSAFISAFAQGGSRFENITFINVSVIHTGSYAALLFGDVINDASETEIVIRNITVMNDGNHWIEGNSYVGGLVGSSRKAVTIDIENVYFESKVKAPNQAAGAIMGRLSVAGIVLNVRQVVVKGSIESAKNVGAVLGTNVSGSTVNASYVFMSDMTQTSGTQTVKIGVGNSPSGSQSNLANLYYDNSTTVFIVGTSSVSVPDGQGLASSEITEAWFESSGFNQTFFKYVNGKIVRQSDHTGPVVQTGFSISTSQIKKYYIVGEDLDLSELSVYGTYSDGSSVLLDEKDYQVDASQFNKNQSGTYTIFIEYDGESKSFTVDVVSITEIEADYLLMKQTYAIGTTLNLDGLVVKAVLDDGAYLRLQKAEYTIDESGINMTSAGTYQLRIAYKAFDPVQVAIYVHETDGAQPATVEIAVNHVHTGLDGEIISSRATFKTVKSALQYLVNQAYPVQTQKRIFIYAGTYNEKITITVPNVVMIGENQETTIITYDAASGTEQPQGGSWGTQGSATVSIKSSATGFMAKNITFQNHYNYNDSKISDKQGVAMVNEADQVIFYQVSFKGFQDTLYAKSGRQYYLNVYVEGVVDYIFGNGGPAFFEGSTIKNLARSTGVISTNKGYNVSSTALITYGYVFYRNTFIFDEGVPAGSVDLGRPWDQQAAIAYIENTFDRHISTRGWTEMSGNQPQNARFYEYMNKNIEDQVLSTTTKGKTLTEGEALLYSDKAVVFGTTNGAITFTSEWFYQQALLSLQGIIF